MILSLRGHFAISEDILVITTGKKSLAVSGERKRNCEELASLCYNLTDCQFSHLYNGCH